jgi:hypothetical protein
MSEFNLPRAAEARAADVNVAADGRDEDDANTMYAVVDANGALARGRRAVSAARLATGAYEVVFRGTCGEARTSRPSGCPVPRAHHSQGRSPSWDVPATTEASS